ncbi:sigma-54 interaction domain-containing protein [Bacillus canaveralius]|uniref:sigma-54 interaction domain-containing protein n=1 Tax=Bacillus canaveralius TaxID=1403243 RepID=UPI000F794566|nr:sigma 54-interacting transcriptional regulator [Bacillus canaveralius]RSK49221.1 PAS domain S-box protein [Bacillus canaveralius]
MYFINRENHCLFNVLPFGLAFFDLSYNLQKLNNVVTENIFNSKDLLKYLKETINTKQSQEGILIEYDFKAFISYYVPVVENIRDITGVLVVLQPLNKFGNFNKQFQHYEELSMDLKAIFDTSYDVIYVSDADGNTLRVSSACEKLWGKKQADLVGRNVLELEAEGIYKPSITRLVLEKGEKISTIQVTKTGRRLMVVGTPIKDENGKIVRVVNASRDITEVSKLNAEIDEMKQLINGYKLELMELRKETNQQKQIIFNSRDMEKVFDLAERVAQVDSTVLILGESGVGKEVIANYIHRSSNRDDKPFIKINCGAIPEDLLESELFGYEKGAFTGANREGKMGLFEAANEGSLFLDEIGEMSLQLQVKLLRVLQEQEVMRIGGTKSIGVNVRIITATNKNLKEEIKKGKFREDLYYRLNVVPLLIPPLRKRREDILPLVIHFVDYFNRKYNKNKTFAPALMDILQQYDWPGNVRELQNIVERLVVISDESEVTPVYFSEIMVPRSINQDKVQVLDILPLKECTELAEIQLLKLAKERFNSTVKIAKALNVNQSTISRKIRKIELS